MAGMREVIVGYILLVLSPSYGVEIKELKSLPAIGEAGNNLELSCKVEPQSSKLWWSHEGSNVTQDVDIVLDDNEGLLLSTLTLTNVSLDSAGVYTCSAYEGQNPSVQKDINITVESEPVLHDSESATVKLGESAKMSCSFVGNPIPVLEWLKDTLVVEESKKFKVELGNEGFVLKSVLEVRNATREDNATYKCRVSNNHGELEIATHLIVQEKPQVEISFVKAVSREEIYVNWTVKTGNAPITAYQFQYKTADGEEWDTWRSTEVLSTEAVIDKLNANSSYQLRIAAKNAVGRGEFSNVSTVVEMLDEEAVIGKLNVNSSYQLRIAAKNAVGRGEFSNVSTVVEMLVEDPILIPKIEVKVRTMSSITVGWEPSYVPSNLTDYIHYYNVTCISHTGTIFDTLPVSKKNSYTWDNLSEKYKYHFQVAACSKYTKKCGPPSASLEHTTLRKSPDPPADVKVECRFDNVSLTGTLKVTWKPTNKNRINRHQVSIEAEWGKEQIREPLPYKTVSNNMYTAAVLTNTKYTVQVCAKDTDQKCGQSSDKKSCFMPPSVPAEIPTMFWKRLAEEKPKIVMVRLSSGQEVGSLSNPDSLLLESYEDVHAKDRDEGAYVAEMFEKNELLQSVTLGDGVLSVPQPQCKQCQLDNRVRRREVPNIELPKVMDGRLDEASNYTGFLQVIVVGEGDRPLKKSSSFFQLDEQSYAPIPSSNPDKTSVLEDTNVQVLLAVVLGLVFVIFVLLGILCLLRRYSKRLAHNQGMELPRYLWRTLRGRQMSILVPQPPPELPPIPKSDLVQAFKDKHKDSDWGFREEFELLPEKFADRTTEASELRENNLKNRYPDIKAYDQTRVKLTPTEGVTGSDYVNANFVHGYKDRRTYICSQGPIDNTVNEFWRMIWEHQVETIVMLTNFEEHGKMKCARYWPTEGTKAFGEIEVSCTAEKAYSDYVLRRLRAEKKPMSNGSTTGSGDGEKLMENHSDSAAVREISHFHYLSWKDFQAPEQPAAVFKFLRRLNHAHTNNQTPVFVHCSAGVGRTGTLVALDTLKEELKEEGQVSIFNTICNLRHQRNYLVQSLKQYIFVYRSLMELAQFGDTEIEVSNLTKRWQTLSNHSSPTHPPLVQQEYQKLSEVVEDKKFSDIAKQEKNLSKNRYTEVIPYDNNQPILMPIPSLSDHTYINASFIQGYDHSMAYILTQDPLPDTILDLWRLVVDRNIGVIVMLSQDGEDESDTGGLTPCPQYWPDANELKLNHLSLNRDRIRTLPLHIQRDISIVNNKNKDVHRVSQFQFLEWSGQFSSLPSSPSALLDLISEIQTHLEVHQPNPDAGQSPVLVHCSSGSDRSSVFVALCILLKQLQTEGVVDVFHTARSLRSQRPAMLSSQNQYEFLYKALVEYVKTRPGVCGSRESL